MERKLLIPSFSLSRTCDDDNGEFCLLGQPSLEWLFRSPSTLLWADSILMAQKDYDEIHLALNINANDYEFEEPIRESFHLLFEALHAENIISTFSPRNYLTDELQKKIETQIEQDEQRWGIEKPPPDPETGLTNHNTIRLGDADYCPPWLRRIYSSLEIARALKAPCLFNTYELNFCRKRFLRLSPQTTSLQPEIDAFDHIFSMYVPDLLPFGDYMLCPEHHSCGNKTCAQKCTDQTEQRIEYNWPQKLDHVLR